jgi:hypothetical protein
MRHQGDSYSALLSAEAQTFTIQPSRTHGLHDIVLTRHASGVESEVKIYRFDGERYQEGECYTAYWAETDSNGELHKFDAPKLTSCGTR